MSRPPRIPNWLPWEQSTIYFLALCVADNKPVLANPRAWKICRAVFHRLDQWIILAAVAMPDHLYILATPAHQRDAAVSAFSKWFKRWFNDAYQNGASTGGDMSWHWQEGCFDRLLRSDESLSAKWEYIRQNPMRAGLVRDPGDWPYQFLYNEDEP